MAKLPRVKLQHKRTGERMNVDLHEYQRDIGGFSRDWKILTVAGGNGSDEQYREHAKALDLEKHRRTDPAEQRKRGDSDRIQAQHAIDVTGTEAGAAIKETISEHEVKQALSSPWFKLRAYVKEKTGKTPKNKAEAEELLSQ